MGNRAAAASPNNLDAVRLVAAALVLYGHSFVFLGLPEPLFLSWLPLGPLGVFVFFTISGYLVSESWARDPSLPRFFARRALRIFPGLAVCTLLSIVVLGPLLTTLPLADYASNPHTRGYLQNIALHIVYYLPGVFEHNRVANAVNGSLWSLPVEFAMYIVLAIVGVLRGSRWVVLGLAVAWALLSALWAQRSTEMLVVYNFDLRQLFLCGTYFWAGVLVQRFDLKRWFSASGTLMAAVARMLPPKGTLILAEPLSGLRATAPVADAYFGLYFAAMGQGRTRTPEELGGMAREAGFASVEVVATRNPVVTGLLRMTMP